MQQPDWTLLARYLEGTATPQEQEAVEAWCQADPAHQALLQRLELIWRTPPIKPGSWDARSAWQKVARRLQLMPMQQDLPPESPIVAHGLMVFGWELCLFCCLCR